MTKSQETLYAAPPQSQRHTLMAQWWKCLSIHFRNEESAARAADDINRQGEKTEHR